MKEFIFAYKISLKQRGLQKIHVLNRIIQKFNKIVVYKMRSQAPGSNQDPDKDPDENLDEKSEKADENAKNEKVESKTVKPDNSTKEKQVNQILNT